jgi:multiple sugar transport system permease protein
VSPRAGAAGPLAKGWRQAFVGLALAGVLGLLLFPVLWLTLTALRPESEVFYVHRGTQVTLANFAKAWQSPKIQESFLNSAVLATLATVFSLQVTVMSGYMLSRFKGATNKLWFTAIYLFRTVPYITWVMPLYLLTQAMGLYDTYLGLLLPHVAVHICFFSWVMKGFFDGVEPELEQAAYLDGCSHWGAFLRIILPQARPGIMALGILCWLFTWNEFLFALILTGSRTPLLTVTMAQFVHELGVEWHLMSATAVMAMIPALVVTLFAQRYVVSGLRL